MESKHFLKEIFLGEGARRDALTTMKFSPALAAVTIAIMGFMQSMNMEKMAIGGLLMSDPLLVQSIQQNVSEITQPEPNLNKNQPKP